MGTIPVHAEYDAECKLCGDVETYVAMAQRSTDTIITLYCNECNGITDHVPT